MAWVIDEAPVPADLAFTLTVIARRCDENGRGSYQSVRVIAEKTGKSPDQVSRDIRRLRELKLLMLGDQNLPAQHGVPAGQRPTVYDLPLWVKGPKPVKESKNPSGRRKSPPGATRVDAPPASAQEVHGSPPTPRIHAGGTPCMDASEPPASMHPKQDRNKTGNKTSVSRAAHERAAARFLRDYYGDGLTDFVVHSVIQEGYDRAAHAGRPAQNIERYLRSWSKDELTDVVYAAQDAEKARSAPALTAVDGHACGTTPSQQPLLGVVSGVSSSAAWCGECNPNTRLTRDPDHPRRCPACHPLRHRTEAS